MKLDRKRKDNREYMAKRRKELREKGLCDACGFTKALAPFRKCAVCMKRQRAYLRKSRGNDRWRAGNRGARRSRSYRN